MHDPNILAFDIKYPWYREQPWPKDHRQRAEDDRERRWIWRRMSDDEKRGCSEAWPNGYRDTFINIWHLDPEKDGSDDSCGWSYVKLTRKQRSRLWNAAWHEGQRTHFLRCGQKEWNGTVADAESLYRGMVLLVARVLRINVSYDEAAKYAAERMHFSDVSNPANVFCFVPGYHTNNSKDGADYRQEHFHGILCGIARGLLTDRRPWWKHPKWHIWHWRFQCIPLQDVKRWLFTRCCRCGKRFGFGESTVTNQWDNPGPRWFRGEPNVYHHDCNRPGECCAQQAQTEA